MALPITGSAELLELLSPFVADDYINETLPRHRGVGRRSDWSAAQLYRTLLLMLLTPARSSNLLCDLLPGQRAWRRFAHLPNRKRLPNVRQLHEFRLDAHPIQPDQSFSSIDGCCPSRRGVAGAAFAGEFAALQQACAHDVPADTE